ncbi:hypothetical protein PR001_g23203 [Phytophthora rubi]|uniref:Chromo domain-containing protein n=2 Tax=Phytophthora rubi TaxID=129364 RepID=A0A6A3IWA7_9STRA|nr:hypothetical protein PR001_g23203 [Phytophthora rubi]
MGSASTFRRTRATEMYYRVRWLGFPPAEDTWELRERLMEDIPDVVKEYEATLALVSDDDSLDDDHDLVSFIAHEYPRYEYLSNDDAIATAISDEAPANSRDASSRDHSDDDHAARSVDMDVSTATPSATSDGTSYPVTPAAKQLPKKKGSAKEDPKTSKLPLKHTDVLRPGPHEEMTSDSSDTDTPNPGYVSGAGSPAADALQAPRARAPAKTHAASATPLQERSPSPDPSLQVDYDESESDKDHEVGEVEGSPPRITDAQRVIHPGSPMSPKTVVAVERARALEASMSRRDDPPPAVQEPQVITNAGVDEGVPPELLQPENRQHLADRSHQAASQAVGTKQDREAHAPRTREQLLALRYWTREEYGAHLRQSRTPGPGAPQCDKCPVVLLSDSGLTRQRNETEFEAWLHRLGYPEPEFMNSPFRIDWLAQCRLRFRMAKIFADDTWSGRFLDRHMPRASSSTRFFRRYIRLGSRSR